MMISDISLDARSWLQRRKDKKQVDEQGNTLMTLDYLKQLCKEQKGYQTPQLNDILYLHFKGFVKIENLEAYFGLKSLWLEGNGISKIENLDHLVDLKCLFLQQNCISVLENLDSLVLLDTLNVSNNMIKTIQGLEKLEKLTTLAIPHNFLTDYDSIKGLLDCPSITVLDLSHNKLEDPKIVDVLVQLPKLVLMINKAVLNLMGNPVISKIQNYRKTLVSQIQTLNYLDDRPVFDKERLTTNAWALGGLEGERLERERIRDEEVAKQQANFEAMKLLQERGREKRLANYGQEKELEINGDLKRFRDEMLDKIKEVDSDVEVVPDLEFVEPTTAKIIELEDDDLLQEAYDEQVTRVEASRITVIEDEESDGQVDQDWKESKNQDGLEETEVGDGIAVESHVAMETSIPPPTETDSLATTDVEQVKYMVPTEQRKADLNLLNEWIAMPETVDELAEPLLDTPVILDDLESDEEVDCVIEKQETLMELEEITLKEGTKAGPVEKKEGWSTEVEKKVVVVSEATEEQEKQVLFVKQNTLIEVMDDLD